jgi:hypothetical protein
VSGQLGPEGPKALVAGLMTTSSTGSRTFAGTATSSAKATSRATVLIRPVLCFASPYIPSQRKSGPVPACTAPYALTPADLGASGMLGPDPALAGYPSSTRDSPTHAVLIGGLGGRPGGQRWVLGPSLMVLSAADVESASAQNRFGQWIVRVHFSPDGSATRQRVFRENFHRLLAIDMGGKVVNADALFEPDRTLGPSWDGVMEIAGVVTASNARAVAAAVKG